jgi:uncharacterized peroxidase-related enzyme
MGLPEYERIANSNWRSGRSVPLNIPAIEESEATGEVAQLYEHFRSHFGRPGVPGILKCFATHPPLLRHMMELSEDLIFSEGSLSRRQKEMIATLVSELNACPYCADSHGYFLRVHGGSAELLDVIQRCDLDSSVLTDNERALLVFARKVNLNSHDIEGKDVELLYQAGWSALQIAETVHITALFSTFNRVVNAFGVESQGLLSLFDPQTGDLQRDESTLERISQ